MKNLLCALAALVILAGTTVVVPDTKPGDIIITPQGDIYQDTGSAIIGPDGVTVRTQTGDDQSFQDRYNDTMRQLDEMTKPRD